MISKSRILKVPEELIGEARKRKCLSSVLFYYRMKSMSSNGFFKIGGISKSLTGSNATIWRHIRFLLDNNLIRKDKGGYRLTKYDELFGFLGYSLRKKGHRNGSFKIHRIPIAALSELEEYAITEDIKLNLNRQTYRALQRTPIPVNKTTPKKHTAFSEAFIELRRKPLTVEDIRRKRRGVFKRLYDEAVTGEESSEGEYCSDVTLSCAGIARISGYKRRSSGSVMSHRLERMSYLKVERRNLFVATFAGNQANFRKRYKHRAYYMTDGIVYLNISNQITPLI